MIDILLVAVAVIGVIAMGFIGCTLLVHDPVTMGPKIKLNRNKPGLIDRWRSHLAWRRKPWALGPAAAEIILSRALAEPRLAEAILASLRLATRHRDMHDLEALEWIVPGSPKDVTWVVNGKCFEVIAQWPNGLVIGREGLTVPNDLLPAAVRTTLPGRKLGELFELPFASPDYTITEEDIRRTKKDVILNIFRDSTEIAHIEPMLKAIIMARTVPGLTVERTSA